jgi:SAM-dependent methyltransferase
MPFAAGHFGAVGACFLFHELPTQVARKAIDEVHRVLRPGGILALVDPCKDHIRPKSYLRLVREHGLLSLYFHLLARGVYEPFLEDWHALGDHDDWLREHGFELLERKVEVPFEYLVARRLRE